MLRAKTQGGNFITLATLPKKKIEYLRKKERFYCPECQRSVIVRAGPKVIPHFAHKSTTHCSIQGGEGAYHQRGKLLLYNWLNEQNINTNLEMYISEIKQRPDLFIRIGKKKIALEYQCATVPITEIKKRNKGYQSAKITPIWILGANLFKRSSHTHIRMNSFTKQFVQQFSPTLPTMLFYFCPLTKMFSIVNDIYMTSVNRALVKIKIDKLHHLPFTHLFRNESFSTHTLFSLWRREKKNFRLQRNRAYGKELNWRYWLYEQGLHRELLPSIVYLPVKGQELMNVPLWNWQSRFIVGFLHLLPTGRRFSFADVTYYLQSFISCKARPFEADPIKEYLYLLTQLNFIKRTEKNYVKVNTIHFYDHIERAIKGDDELLYRFMYNQE